MFLVVGAALLVAGLVTGNPVFVTVGCVLLGLWSLFVIVTSLIAS